MASPKPTRKALTLEQRVDVIRLSEKGLSIRQIAEKTAAGRTQIGNILKRKAEVLSDFENNVPMDTKRKVRKTGNEEVNKLCWEWFQDCSARGICVSGPMLCEKALKFAKDLGNSEFKGSNGWLESFLRRHNIVFKTLSGESADVNKTCVTDWKTKLGKLCEGYAPCDIYNMDETGLVFKDSLSGKSYREKGKECSGGKRSKERITVSVCSSMTGDKEPLLVIGKAERPRCFKAVDVKSLPVLYRFNKKAWMTGQLFTDWLNRFNRKMKRQGRHVLLFLDNAPSHPKVEPSNVKLLFFPPNTTSHLQPMDQGIIQSIKLKYRKRQLQYIITQMDRHKHLTGTQLLRNINILEAIYWVHNAWMQVDTSTIQKCFEKAGFSGESSSSSLSSPQEETEDSSVELDDEDDDIPLAVFKMSRDIFGVDFKELSDIDGEVGTCDSSSRDWDANAATLLQSDIDSDGSEAEDSVCDVNSPSTPPVSLCTAQDCIQQLKAFALEKGQTRLFSDLMAVETHIVDIASSSTTVQPKISDFFRVDRD